MEPFSTTAEIRTEAPAANIRLMPFDSGGKCARVTGTKEVRRLAVRGVGATGFFQAFGILIQLVTTPILARLLVPADFGLVTMVTTFSLLFLNAGGNGFTEAVLQREEMDRRLASNLFWINVGLGAVLTAVFAGAGSLMARFYGNAHVAGVAIGLSLSILFTSTAVLHLALLMRAMRFTVVYANQAVARGVSLLATIVLAWVGWGYWALVWGAVAQPLSECIGAWILCRWIPGLPGRVAGTASMVRFALNVYGRFSLNYLDRNMDNILVGWRFNDVALGFYKKAYDLFAFSTVLKSFTPVAVSALSSFSRDAGQYKRYLLGTLSTTAFLGMGVGVTLTLAGEDLIRLVLGPGWEPAGRIFTFFAPGMAATFLYGAHGWIHLSSGRADRWLKWGVVEFVVTGLLFILGLRWGPVGIATASSIALWVLTIPALWYAGRPVQLGIAALIGAIWEYIAAAVLAGCVTAVVVGRLPLVASDPVSTGIRIAITSAVFGILYIAATTMLQRSFAPMYQFIDLIREMLPAGSRFSRSAAGGR